MTPISLGPAAESKPIREIAYETLKHAIITGDLPAGSRIVETDYAERMHISRTPLREALRATVWWNICCAAASSSAPLPLRM